MQEKKQSCAEKQWKKGKFGGRRAKFFGLPAM
jgi:hypothetical protein